MKLVTLAIVAMFISFSAPAQTGSKELQKRTVQKIQQKKKSKTAKFDRPKATAQNTDVTTLTDERAHKAKWSFEEMLKRRLEIDAEEGERQQGIE